MKRLIFFVTVLMSWLTGQTQESAELGERQYFYDGFLSGSVYFSEGTPVQAKLNYNFVTQNMLFVNPQNSNEVLDLVRQPNMTHIEIGKDVFVPIENGGYAYVIQDGEITLLKRKHIIVEADKTGAYGVPSNTAAVTSPTIIHTTTTTTYLASQTKTRIEKDFYLMKENKVYRATKKNYLKLYPKIKPQIKEFLSQHKVNFNKEEDLRGLSKYCNSLMMSK